MKHQSTLVASAALNISTMSTVEISELTDKRHDNVMRTAKRLFDKGIIKSPQIEATDSQNKRRSIYYLTKTESLNLVANLSPEFTARIIERWQQLESNQPKQLSRMDILQMAMDAEKEVQALTHQVGEMKPTIAAFDRIAKAENSMTVTEAAKNLQIQPKKLTAWLSSNKWLYKRVGAKHWLGYQDRIQAGLIEHKVSVFPRNDGTEKVTTQARITPKGITKLSVQLGGAS